MSLPNPEHSIPEAAKEDISMRSELSIARIIETGTRGLCSTCNNSATCALRLRRGFDALYCEMFDDYVPPMTEVIDEVKLGSLQTGAGSEKTVSTPLKGLCVNCKNRETCGYPKAEGGVWHCEEYE